VRLANGHLGAFSIAGQPLKYAAGPGRIDHEFIVILLIV